MRNQDAFGLADIALGENNEWNELHFVSRSTFAQMAPSVLTLELNRLDKLIEALPIEDERRNGLVTARYRLQILREMVTDDFGSADLEACDAHLSAAILAIGLRARESDESEPVLDNVTDRLSYVRERLRRLKV